jgi:hypothetical protein
MIPRHHTYYFILSGNPCEEGTCNSRANVDGRLDDFSKYIVTTVVVYFYFFAHLQG